jgi:hypothetical protein
MEFSAVVFSVLPSFIYVAAWVVAIVFAVRMVKHGGSKPERFFLIGAFLMLASSVVQSITAGLSPWLPPKLIEAGTNYTTIGMIFSAIHFVRAFISLAGIIFLIYAFWRKFKTESAPSVYN